jgi:hypothetical protein
MATDVNDVTGTSLAVEEEAIGVVVVVVVVVVGAGPMVTTWIVFVTMTVVGGAVT